MGLLGYIITKSIQRATIRTIGHAAAEVVSAKANANTRRANAETQKIKAEIEKINTGKRAVHTSTTDESVRVKPPRSSEDYLDMDALLAVKELLGAGFVNITLKPERRLSKKSKRYGKIRTISINGNSGFLGIRKVPTTSNVVITYSDFKNGIDEDAYTNVIRIVPGVVHCAADVAKMENPTLEIPEENNTIDSIKRYCIYCGEPVTNVNAKFCYACGNEVLK